MEEKSGKKNITEKRHRGSLFIFRDKQKEGRRKVKAEQSRNRWNEMGEKYCR